MVYFLPQEFDPKLPKVDRLPLKRKFKTYIKWLATSRNGKS